MLRNIYDTARLFHFTYTEEPELGDGRIETWTYRVYGGFES